MVNNILVDFIENCPKDIKDTFRRKTFDYGEQLLSQ